MKKNKKLFELVIKEAINLKKYATKKQLSKLNIKTLDPDQTDLCIYGQMTGDCNSAEAQKLIIQCCDRVYSTRNAVSDILKKAKLSGKPEEIFGRRIYKYISPIEAFIYRYPEYNGELIQFLKGKREELKF